MTQNQLPPLARQALDRDYLSRDNAELFEQLANRPDSRVLLISDGKVRIDPTNPSTLKLEPLTRADLSSNLVYLGKAIRAEQGVSEGAGICLKVIGPELASQLEPDKKAWVSLRSAGGQLSEFYAGIFTQGLALANWHQNYTHCPGCGAATSIEKAGWVRRCNNEGTELFPRTDPAIIVSILDQQDRILLGSQAAWGENKWSVLAGFVEPGESLEAAVIREMKEESGLDVSEPTYLYSQGWPYPISLMLGFTARANSNQPLKPDGEEIVRLRWFSKAELATAAGQMYLPGRSTISRAMIELWYGSQLQSLTETNGNGFQ